MKLIFIYSYNFKPIERPKGFENLPAEMKAAIEQAEKNKLRFFDLVSFDFDKLEIPHSEIVLSAIHLNERLKNNEYAAYHSFYKMFFDFMTGEGQNTKQIAQRENFQLRSVLTLNTDYTL